MERQVLLSPSQLSARLGCTTAWVYALIKSGEFGPVVKVGRSTFIPKSSWDRWLREKREANKQEDIVYATDRRES